MLRSAAGPEKVIAASSRLLVTSQIEWRRHCDTVQVKVSEAAAIPSAIAVRTMGITYMADPLVRIDGANIP